MTAKLKQKYTVQFLKKSNSNIQSKEHRTISEKRVVANCNQQNTVQFLKGMATLQFQHKTGQFMKRVTANYNFNVTHYNL